jgi:hypothetical protein
VIFVEPIFFPWLSNIFVSGSVCVCEVSGHLDFGLLNAVEGGLKEVVALVCFDGFWVVFLLNPCF